MHQNICNAPVLSIHHFSLSLNTPAVNKSFRMDKIIPYFYNNSSFFLFKTWTAGDKNAEKGSAGEGRRFHRKPGIPILSLEHYKRRELASELKLFYK
jgi:hypothetical protein